MQPKMLSINLPFLPPSVKRFVKRRRSSQTRKATLAMDSLDIISCLDISKTTLHMRSKSEDSTDTILPRSFSSIFLDQVPLTDGSTCTVYKATDIETNRQVALKKGDLFFDRQQMNNEYRILRRLPRHPHILQAYGLLIDSQHDEVCLVLELCSRGSLIDLIYANPAGVASSVFQSIAQNLASAGAVMHSCGIVHRDIKPDNIGMTEDNTVRILDFGEAIDLRTDARLRLRAGSSRYMAPELIVEASLHDGEVQIQDCALDIKKCDVWALGITFYCLLTGAFPLHIAHCRDPKYEAWVTTGTFGPASKWETLDEKYKVLLINMLNPRPFDRWTMAEAHQYLLNEKQPLMLY